MPSHSSAHPLHVAIIGFGVEGASALHYWQDRGASVTVCTRNPKRRPPEGVRAHVGPDYLHNLDRFDIIVRTASVHPRDIVAASPGVEDRITSVVDEFLRVSPTRNIIGITGTKGKGTTSSLTARMLEAAGHKVWLAGNIGRSPLDFINDISPDDWVVLELSSYQLFDIKHSPRIGAVLMVEPEHLTWHADYTDYQNAKSQLFAHQTAHDTAIYFADSEVSHDIASVSPGKKIPYCASPGAYVQNDEIIIDDTVLCAVDEVKLLGQHNWQNICAAATVTWQIAQAPDAIRQVITTFSGLDHRLEPVRELDGIRYYNDSFASAPPAAEAAIMAIPGHKVMILGGYDRHLPLDNLVVTIKEQAGQLRSLLLIGESAGRLAEELKRADFTNFHVSQATTMGEIVTQARSLARSGDAIVLSPGFPSFDMFDNFEDRGLQFKKEVARL
jgi:UDP-N-acetylmuramoylalanine--D-glutamate ligase